MVVPVIPALGRQKQEDLYEFGGQPGIPGKTPSQKEEKRLASQASSQDQRVWVGGSSVPPSWASLSAAPQGKLSFCLRFPFGARVL